MYTSDNIYIYIICVCVHIYIYIHIYIYVYTSDNYDLCSGDIPLLLSGIIIPYLNIFDDIHGYFWILPAHQLNLHSWDQLSMACSVSFQLAMLNSQRFCGDMDMTRNLSIFSDPMEIHHHFDVILLLEHVH